MGHKNYSKFSTPFSKQNNAPVEEVNNEVMDNQITIDEVVAEEPVEAVENPEVVEVIEEAVVAPSTTIGVVSGCGKLNVREEASMEADIVTVISQGTQATVNLAESTEDFYSVITIDGKVGYCLKKFITIK